MDQLKTLSLTNKKKPKDDNHHLAFSLTKDAAHQHHYAKLPRAKNYQHKKAQHERELAEDARRLAWWRPLEEKIEEKARPIAQEGEAFIAVKKIAHRRSPHVARIAPAAKKETAEKPAGKEWLYEVERLRRDGAEKYKNKAAKIEINFLSKRRAKIKQARQTFKKSCRPWPEILKNFPLAVIMWAFEFILSIPLGLLLLAHGLLILVEKLSGLFVATVQSFGRGLLWFISEVFIGLVVLVKALLMIPLKILTLVFFAIFRIISSLGQETAYAFNHAFSALKQVGKTLARAPRRVFKQALAAAAIAGLIIAPLKFAREATNDIRVLRGQVLGAAQEGFSLLRQGQAEAAGKSLQEAQSSLDSVNVVLRTLIKLSPQGASGADLIQAGEDISQAAEYINIGLAPFINKTDKEGSVAAAIKNLSGSLSLASPHIASAQNLLSGVDSAVIPEEYRAKFILAQELLPKVSASLNDLIQLADSLAQVLGAEGERRYAVLFQNNNELRPAGGFIGSLALVSVDKGRITKIDIPGGGSYDFQGYLTKHVLAPKPLALINARWQLQDANWYPDWPTSAAKVAWFLENAGESTVDGVIALQATTLQELLRVLGPVDFPEYKASLNADNIIKEIQTAVELNYDKAENQPKKYIAELAPKVLDKILASTAGDFEKLFGLIQKQVAEKNVLFYFRDQALNQEFIDRGWAPSVVKSELDYLSVIHANIGGGKTDGVMEESWDQQISIAEDGSAVAELTISRFHKGDINDPFEKANNVDYVRVYAPAGSELIDASGFKAPPASLFEKAEDFYVADEELSRIEGKVLLDEYSGTRITQEFGKTVFGNWVQTAPGKTSQAVFKYKLPFKVMPGGYSLLIQKQAGARPIDYTVNVSYPENWNLAWKKVVGEGVIDDKETGKLLLTGVLNKDTGFGALFTE